MNNTYVFIILYKKRGGGRKRVENAISKNNTIRNIQLHILQSFDFQKISENFCHHFVVDKKVDSKSNIERRGGKTMATFLKIMFVSALLT